MTSTAEGKDDLLERFLAEPENRRAEFVRRRGAYGAGLCELARHAEKLAMTQVSRALEATEALVGLADEADEAAARVTARRARAQSLAYAGRFAEALPVCEESVALARAAALTVEGARSQLAAVHALVHLARYDEALAAATEARDTFAAAGERILEGRAETSLGGLHQKCERPREALRHFERARELLHDEPVALAQLESNRGLALLSLDDLDGAEAAYRNALRAFGAQGLSWAAAIVENNLAVLMTRQGRLQEALAYFEQARRHLEDDAAPAELARVLAEQAEALLVLGAVDQAQAQFERALPVLEETGQVREAVGARAGLARVSAMRRQVSTALTLLRQTEKQYAQLGQIAERARLRLVEAELLREMGDVNAAQSLATEALEASAGRPLDTAIAHYQVARALLAAGNLAGAERALAAGLGVAETLRVAPLLADLLHTRGLLERARGRHQEAVRQLGRATEQVERMRGALQAERFRAALQANRVVIYEDLAAAALDTGEPAAVRDAFAAAERAKGRLLLDLMRHAGEVVPSAAAESNADVISTELTQLLNELNALYSRLADAVLAGVSDARMESWQREIAQRERRLDSLQSRGDGLSGVPGLFAKPEPLAGIQAQLKPREGLIEHFAIGNELIAFLVREDGPRVFRGLARVSDIVDVAERLHFQVRRALRPGRAGRRRSLRLVDDMRDVLGRLYDLTMRPIAAACEGLEHMACVPHGLLHALPVHAGWDGRQHLIERFSVSHAPSGSAWAQLRKRSARGAPRDADRTLVAGVADALAPRIEEEARAVHALLGGDMLVGAEATAGTLLAHMSEAEVLHIACHGHFSPRWPLSSGLKLADRWLTVREIASQRLRAKLVTLSACETGKNVVDAGDELVGLSRSFIAAGARSLVMSLWKVSDESTSALMSSFYRRLADQGGAGDIAEALRAAQLECKQDQPHPAFWAAFLHVGSS